MDYKEIAKEAFRRLKKSPSGHETTLKDLFDESEWESFGGAVNRAGISFRDLVKKSSLKISDRKDDTNQHHYKKY